MRNENINLELQLLGFLWKNPDCASIQEIAQTLNVDHFQIKKTLYELADRREIPYNNIFAKTFLSTENSSQGTEKLEKILDTTTEKFGLLHENCTSQWETALAAFSQYIDSLLHVPPSEIEHLFTYCKQFFGIALFHRIKDKKLSSLCDKILEYYHYYGYEYEYLFFNALFTALPGIPPLSTKQTDEFLERLKRLEKQFSSPEFYIAMGMLQYHNRNFVMVLECYNLYSAYIETSPSLLHDIFCTQVSLVAYPMREYHISFGIVESHRKTAELQGKNRHSFYWNLHVIFVLLHAAEYEKAKENIEHLYKMIDTWDISDKINDTSYYFMFFVLHRGIAYYHFLHNNFEKAVQSLNERPKHNNTRKPVLTSITDHEIVKMILYLGQDHHLHNYPYEEVYAYLKKAGNLIEGSAYTFLAQFEKNNDTKLTLLRKAFTLLKTAKNNKEFKNCAKRYLNALKENEATAEYQKVQELLQTHGKFHEHDSTEGHPLLAKTFNCVEMLSAMPKHESAADSIFHLLGIIQRELGAQRLALMLYDKTEQSIDVRHTVNISKNEQNTIEFQEVVKSITYKAKDIKNKDVKLLNINQHAYAILFPSEKNFIWVLFLNNTFSATDLIKMDEKEATLFAFIMDAELRAIAKYLPEKDLQKQNFLANPQVQTYLGKDMDTARTQATQIAPTEVSVLIHGDTGTGKEEMARFIYKKSLQTGAFIPVQLSCISEHLFESELFGHEKGSFTGAIKQKLGLLELANNGTIFFDEIADISMNMQIKLLRVLQEKSFTRVGGTEIISSQFRLIAASNKNLWAEVQAGRFREDLYYRIAIFNLYLPPLRERKRDLKQLISIYLSHFNHKYYQDSTLFKSFSKEELKHILDYSWPGNIRELQHIVEQYVILGTLNIRSSVTKEVTNTHSNINALSTAYSDQEYFQTPLISMKELEKKHIQSVLHYTKGKIYGHDGALSILGYTKSTFYKRLDEFQIKYKPLD